MGLSRPDPTGLVKFISKWAGCQVSGKPGRAFQFSQLRPFLSGRP
jgi:hypothetical protein